VKDSLLLGCVLNAIYRVAIGGSITRKGEERRKLDLLGNISPKDRVKPNLQRLKLFVTSCRKEGRARRAEVQNTTF
jgi:hypothetical protein